MVKEIVSGYSQYEIRVKVRSEVNVAIALLRSLEVKLVSSPGRGLACNTTRN
jgi:hypothetical protein